MGPSDEELVAAVQAGNTAAFDVLVERWDSRIQRAIHRVVGSQDEARDLSQEAFLKAYRALPGFKREARFSSWLYQIALNLSRDRLRRRRGRQQVSLEEWTATAPEASSSAHALVEARDLGRAVAAAMATLPVEQREVVVLKEYEGFTFQEIAELLGVPVSTAKTRLYRGLTQLRQDLERQGIRPPAAEGGAERRAGDA